MFFYQLFDFQYFSGATDPVFQCLQIFANVSTFGKVSSASQHVTGFDIYIWILYLPKCLVLKCCTRKLISHFASIFTRKYHVSSISLLT